MSGKFASPPPLPEDVLLRVWKVASLDGRMLLIIATVFALLAAAVREAPGTIAGVLAAGAGAMELHGANLLRVGEPRGVRWLIASQLGLLLVVLGYIVARILLFDPTIVDAVLTPDLEAQFASAGVARGEIPQFVEQVFRIGYGILALGTVCYQGGMAWFFFKHRGAVQQALANRHPAVEQTADEDE